VLHCKAKAHVQEVHSFIGNTRRDFLHETLTVISKNRSMGPARKRRVEPKAPILKWRVL
jgi:hypothetical protein